MLGNESILAVDYRIDGDILYRYHSNVVERIAPWGADAAAWRIAAGEWQPFTPEVDISSVEETARRPGPSRLPSWLRRVAACRFLIERWPEEVREGARRFSSAHWQLLQFVNAGGAPALELLRSNPALGYLTAVAGATNQTGLRRRSLAAFFGFPETEHAVRLLRKVPTAWVSGEFLAELRTAMTDEQDTDAVLTHLARINPIALEVARDPELRATVEPDCMARLSHIPASVSHCDLIARMRNLAESARCEGQPRPRIRRLSDLDRPVSARIVDAPPVTRSPAPRLQTAGFPAAPPREGAVPANLPPPVPRPPDPNPPLCAAQVRVRVSQRARRTNPYEFPPPPLPDFDAAGIKIRAIRSRADLIAESDAMNHCAGRDRSYARRVAGGRLYFYRMIEPQRLTIAIRPRRYEWVVEEVRGICNGRPSAFSITLIGDWVRQSSEHSVEIKPFDQAVSVRTVLFMLRQPIPRSRHRIVPANQLSFDFTLNL